MGWATMQLHGVPNYAGHSDITEIIRNMAPVNSGFHMQKNFSKNYHQFGHAFTKFFPALS
jgi:hypothetical protein